MMPDSSHDLAVDINQSDFAQGRMNRSISVIKGRYWNNNVFRTKLIPTKPDHLYYAKRQYNTKSGAVVSVYI
jgi:hypothetical protein